MWGVPWVWVLIVAGVCLLGYAALVWVGRRIRGWM